jgi:hypothetical protein
MGKFHSASTFLPFAFRLGDVCMKLKLETLLGPHLEAQETEFDEPQMCNSLIELREEREMRRG